MGSRDAYMWAQHEHRNADTCKLQACREFPLTSNERPIYDATFVASHVEKQQLRRDPPPPLKHTSPDK